MDHHQFKPFWEKDKGTTSLPAYELPQLQDPEDYHLSDQNKLELQEMTSTYPEVDPFLALQNLRTERKGIEQEVVTLENILRQFKNELATYQESQDKQAIHHAKITIELTQQRLAFTHAKYKLYYDEELRLSNLLETTKASEN